MYKPAQRILGLLAAALACSAALATTPTPPPPPPPPPPGSTSTSSSDSSSTAGAAAGAVSGAASNATGGAVGDTTATGGQGGNGYGGVGVGGSSRSSASGGDSSSVSESGDLTNRSTTNYLNFPQPVWTTVPTPYGCLVSESGAWAVGWSFGSKSGTRQYSDAVCTTIRMAEAAMLHCHFATAAHLNKAAFELMYPDKKGDFFMEGAPQNLGPVACDELRRPNLRMVSHIQSPPPAPPVVVQTTAPEINVQCAAPAPARVITRSTPKKRVTPPCVDCCK